MAILNRTSLKQKISDFINRVSPFDIEPLIQKNEDKIIRDDVADSAVLRSADTSSISNPTASQTIDFSQAEIITMNTSGALPSVFTLTISNLRGNEVGKIVITKKNNDTFLFANALEMTKVDQTGSTLVFFVMSFDTGYAVIPAKTVNDILVSINDPRLPTQNENDALQGTNGSPSGGNRYVTNSDTRLPTQNENDALLGTSGTPSVTNRFVTDSDSRLTVLGADVSDQRTDIPAENENAILTAVADTDIQSLTFTNTKSATANIFVCAYANLGGSGEAVVLSNLLRKDGAIFAGNRKAHRQSGIHDERTTVITGTTTVNAGQTVTITQRIRLHGDDYYYNPRGIFAFTF